MYNTFDISRYGNNSRNNIMGSTCPGYPNAQSMHTQNHTTHITYTITQRHTHHTHAHTLSHAHARTLTRTHTPK
jgi:hypothetical protein